MSLEDYDLATGAIEEFDHEANNSDVERENEGKENEMAVEEAEQEAKVKRVRNPQPKLNVERLKGPHGIHVLEDYFKKQKFKGQGHEEEDLNTLMTSFEYWGHRLFPKLPFNDSILKIEQLGMKKPLQTHIKKIRMNMLDLDETAVPSPNRNDDAVNDSGNDEAMDDNGNDAMNNGENELNTANIVDDRPLKQSPIPNTQRVTVEEIKLTDEQLEQIRLNRERAIKIRLEKLKQTEDQQTNTE